MYELHKPILKLNEAGLTFDGAIRLADADRHTKIILNRERCIELLFTAYDCGRYGSAPLLNGVIPTITRAIANWNTGERHLRQEARVAINQIKLPEPARTSAAYLARMTNVQEKYGLSAMEKVMKYSEDQPRQPAGAPDSAGGQFAPENDDDESTPELVNTPITDVAAEKRDFVDKYYEDTKIVADELNIPIEFLLGLGAKESGFGSSRFATDGNNPFGLQSGALYSGTPMPALKNPKAREATFDDYATCLRSFADIYGFKIYGIHDALTFSTTLQDAGHFGYDGNTRNQEYPAELANTIRHLTPYVRAYEAKHND